MKTLYLGIDSTKQGGNLSDEEWKTIPSHPRYEASSHGRIRIAVDSRKKRRGDILALKITACGYLSFTACNPGVKAVHVLVHRAVMEAFSGPAGDRFVNHIDFNKQRNERVNLEYVSREENERHALIGGRKNNTQETRAQFSGEAVGRKLTREDVLEIRRLHGLNQSARQLSERYNVSRAQVGRICKGTRWGWL